MKVPYKFIFSGILWATTAFAEPIPDTGSYRFGEPECLYTDSQMTEIELANGIGVKNGYNPYVDHSLWAIKRKNGTLRFYYRSLLHQSYHEGHVADRSFFGYVVSSTLYIREYTDSWKNPMRKRTTGIAWPRQCKKPLSGIPSDQMEFIPNVYALSENELIGFVHIERRPFGLMTDKSDPAYIPDRLYAIGIARSIDAGGTWRYCGDVVLPHWDDIGDKVRLHDGSLQTVMSNIGGVPYLIVPDSSGRNMVYIYFNELSDKTSSVYPAVAGAPLDSVVASAREGKVVTSHWKKWSAPAGSADPLYGLAGRVLPPEPPNCSYDMHSDAVYCSATGRYLLTVNCVDNRRYSDSTMCSLLLFSSKNGTDWRPEAELDRSRWHLAVYSSFISESAGATIDDHEVGRDFYLMYARRPYNGNEFSGDHPDLYMIRVQAGDAAPAE